MSWKLVSACFGDRSHHALETALSMPWRLNMIGLDHVQGNIVADDNVNKGNNIALDIRVEGRRSL